MFESTEEDSVPSLHSEDDELQRYLRYGLNNNSLQPPTPPLPQTALEEETKPTYRILPYVKRSTVELKFPRKTLEEFMDR